jgi:hypothetical protein
MSAWELGVITGAILAAAASIALELLCPFAI